MNHSHSLTHSTNSISHLMENLCCQQITNSEQSLVTVSMEILLPGVTAHNKLPIQSHYPFLK